MSGHPEIRAHRLLSVRMTNPETGEVTELSAISVEHRETFVFGEVECQVVTWRAERDPS